MIRYIKKVKFIIIFTLSAIVILAGTKTFKQAPVQEFEDYHKAFEEAYEARAYFYAEELFSDAIYLSKKAYEKWEFENTQWVMVRDYKELRRMILLAMSAAEEANEKARQYGEIYNDSTNSNNSNYQNLTTD